MQLPKLTLLFSRKRQRTCSAACKQLLLGISFCAAGVLAHAQPSQARKPLAVNPLKDKLEYGSFTIRLLPTMDGNFGFDILQGNKLVRHQTGNPLPGVALTEKKDAFFTAKWLIDAYRQNGRFPQAFPPAFERQLRSFTTAQPH